MFWLRRTVFKAYIVYYDIGGDLGVLNLRNTKLRGTVDSAEALNGKFLATLEKVRIACYDDKQLAKIMAKMQKGKNLKKKEFAKIYFLLREQH